MSDPLQVEIHGEAIELTEDEARSVLQSLHRQFTDRAEAERTAQREAGQVWIATYWRYGAREEDEFFSLKEAASYLDHGEEYGDLSSESILCPDGTVYTSDERVDMEWSLLPALKKAS